MSERIILERIAAPNCYDQAPKGTICKVKGSLDESIEIYIQQSEKEDSPPNWVHIGSYNSDTTTEELIELCNNISI